MRRPYQRAADHQGQDHGRVNGPTKNLSGNNRTKVTVSIEFCMKKVVVYRPTTAEEAMELLSRHGNDAAVYAGGTDLLIRLKNGLTQAPRYLVDIKKISNLRYIRDDANGGVQIGALTKLSEMVESPVLAR